MTMWGSGPGGYAVDWRTFFEAHVWRSTMELEDRHYFMAPNSSMLLRDVVTSGGVSYQGWMLVHSMMFGCAGLFRQTLCTVQFYNQLNWIC